MTNLKEILACEPRYRLKQIEKAWFDVSINFYAEITTLPAELREKLKDSPWLSLKAATIQTSKIDNTRRILFELNDGRYIETVLMGRKNLKESATVNDPDRYTICISSEVGCPMRCAFCATGRQGFKRNLTAEEIIDQYRFCQRLLAKEGSRVNNIVVMGQGEPLLNYENMKEALQILLKNTDLGETKITVSTAGVPAVMEKMLEDKDFPKVRWAVSLHSAIEETRKQIMPSHKKDFLNFLIDWSKKYRQLIPSRTHFIGLEYIMLHGTNDDDRHLTALIKLAKRMPHVRINLIPYNTSDDPEVVKGATSNNFSPLLGEGQREGSGRQESNIQGSSNLRGNTPLPLSPKRGERTLGERLVRSESETIEHWHKTLMAAGFTSTIRYSQGQDIFAACGQLSNVITRTTT